MFNYYVYITAMVTSLFLISLYTLTILLLLKMFGWKIPQKYCFNKFQWIKWNTFYLLTMFKLLVILYMIIYDYTIYDQYYIVIITSILQGLDQKNHFYEGWSWFKFSNLGLALSMALIFNTSVAPFLPSWIGLKDCSNFYWRLVSPTETTMLRGT